MQYNLDAIKQELNELALVKRRRALIGMPENYQMVFQLLPLLLHFNHPMLPGYIRDDICHGIAHYEPDDFLSQMLLSTFHLSIDKLVIPDEPMIAGVYSMGSTCSVGQTIESDLDVWICIEKKFTDEQRELLQQKCYLIEQWAQSLNTDMTLFIVDINRFKDKHHECLMGENCGSAQHMLLLEEFYRTANQLAGKFLLWYLIPSNFVINGKHYDSYDDCIDALVNNKLIDRDDWIDFGSILTLSAEEYFGASLWQLYKSVDSPFKSVLKTLLLEAYSWEYPETLPIAYEMKIHIHNHDTKRFAHLDSYYMLLDKLTRYFTATNDHQRLELARSCFYIKVNEKLSVPTRNPNWRRLLLIELVKAWGWDKKKVQYLDQHRTWKIEAARYVHDQLLQLLMTSYRNLLHFGRRNNLDSLISLQDLTVLTRKLYTAFEELPSKIALINPNISGNLAEENMTFIHVKKDRINRPGWYIYNQKPEINSIIGHQYLEYSKYLVQLVAWGYFNGLITQQTIAYVRDGENYDNGKVNQLVKDLADYFPIQIPPATEEALNAACEIRHLAIMINVGSDPTFELSESDDEQDALGMSILDYGEQGVSLIGSIDLLYRNSWNEIRVLHFNGALCVLDAIKTLLNSMHKDADIPNAIKIFCYSKHLKQQTIEQMRVLMDRCVELRLSTTKNNLTQFKPLRIGGHSWCLFFERLGVSIHQFENTIDFYRAISNNKLQGRALNILDETIELPKEIDSVACEGIIQLFFEDTDFGFDLYILNEHNQVEIYRNCNGNKKNMVKDVNNYYVLSDDRFTFSASSAVNFNLPQFYQIIAAQDGHRLVEPFN